MAEKEKPIVNDETGKIKVKAKKEKQPDGNETKGNVTKVKAKMKSKAEVIEKTLRSAVSNLMQQNEETNLDPEVLKIKEAFVNGGPVMKRFRAASMGRASRLRRPTSHLTIVVSDEN